MGQGDGLPVFFLGRLDRAHSRARPRDVDRHPGLVFELARRAELHHLRIQVDDGISCFLVVVVDEARHKDSAFLLLVAVEGDPAVVEHPVRTRADDWIGSGREAVDRRRLTFETGVLREPGQQRAGPGIAAVDGRVHT